MGDVFIKDGCDIYHCRWNGWTECENLVSSDLPPPEFKEDEKGIEIEVSEGNSVYIEKKQRLQYITLDNGAQKQLEPKEFNSLVKTFCPELAKDDALFKTIEEASKPEISEFRGVRSVFKLRHFIWRDPRNNYDANEILTITVPPKSIRAALKRLKAACKNPDEFKLLFFVHRNLDCTQMIAKQEENEKKRFETYFQISINGVNSRGYTNKPASCKKDASLTEKIENSITLAAVKSVSGNNSNKKVPTPDDLLRIWNITLKSGGVEETPSCISFED